MLKKLIHDLKAPLIFLGLFFLMFLIWEIWELPEQEEILRLAEEYFRQYGMIAVFLSAILEGILLVGLYFPGSFVILLSVTLFGDDPNQLIGIIFSVVAGLLVSYTFNFFLGQYGWHKLLVRLGLEGEIEKVKDDLLKHGRKTILLTAWHPNFAALTATAAGILHVPFREYFYYASQATVAWCLFWGILAYLFGSALISFGALRFVFLFVLLMVVLRILYIVFTREHGEEHH